MPNASMKGANFHQAILAKADLSHADLQRANFCRADLYETNLTGARLSGANLQGVQLARTNLRGAQLPGSTVYGAACWDLLGEPSDQSDLIIRYRPDPRKDAEEELEVEGLDLAAFLYYTLSNRNISRIIAGAAGKWVLLLGRFPKRGGTLRALRAPLKRRGLIPIIFDFPRAAHSDLIEQVMLLAGMSKFIIVASSA
jgi:Pentapeptide repeats (8 copies)